MKHINPGLPAELLVEIDDAAIGEGLQRTEFIRRVLEDKLGGKNPEALRKASEQNPSIFWRLNDS